MDRAQAYVFDAYDTLFDVHAVVTALQAVTPEGEAVSRQWQLSQAFPVD
jgi:HAD superfamily hydrolase (TIGR01493 family)